MVTKKDINKKTTIASGFLITGIVIQIVSIIVYCIVMNKAKMQGDSYGYGSFFVFLFTLPFYDIGFLIMLVSLVKLYSLHKVLTNTNSALRYYAKTKTASSTILLFLGWIALMMFSVVISSLLFYGIVIVLNF